VARFARCDGCAMVLLNRDIVFRLQERKRDKMDKIMNKGKIVLICTSLLLLSSCWFGSKDSQENAVDAPVGEILASMDGHSLITVGQFNDYYNQVIESQPGLKDLIAKNPNEVSGFKARLFENMLTEELAVAWTNKEGKHNDKDYQQARNNLLRMTERTLAMKVFSEAHKVTVSEADAKKFYDQNKTSPYLAHLFVAKAGGKKARAVSFGTAAAAQVFGKGLTPASFAKKAKDSKFKIEDLGIVSVQSRGIDPSLVLGIVRAKKAPAVIAVQGKDGKFYVVALDQKIDDIFRSFKDVKDLVVELVTNDKTQKHLAQELGKLKKKYNISLNEKFFKKPVAPASAQAPKKAASK
jgi:hypothetical protein